MVRRLILRRVEDTHARRRRRGPLSGPELTWLRYLGRDLGVMTPKPTDTDLGQALPQEPVGAWLDSAKFPT